MRGSDADRSVPAWNERWTPFLAGAATVLAASLLPVPDALAVSGADPGGGGAVGPLASLGTTGAFHLIGYAGLAALAARATGRRREAGRETAGIGVPGALLAVGASVAVGLCAELLQSQVAWRSFAWVDAGVNAVGAVLGVAAVAALRSVGRADRGTGGKRR